MSTELAFRRATVAEAPHLLAIRQNAITFLAPRGMPATKAEAWAANLTLSGMEQKLRDLEVWVAEANCPDVKTGTNVSRETEFPVSPHGCDTSLRSIAWGAIQGNCLAGLYVLAEYSGSGIGAALLSMLQDIMQAQGHSEVRTLASENAERFYLRNGYVREGAPRADGGLPMIKRFGR